MKLKPIKQTVYLPTNGDGLKVTKGGYDTYDIVEEQKGYFFTPEQLNELLSGVIKQSLETAAEKAEINDFDEHGQYSPCLDEKSITNTFEETLKSFEV